MRTLSDIRKIQNYLDGKTNGPARLVFEARLIIDPVLKLNLNWQRRLCSIVRLSGRKKIKAEVEKIHTQLFTNPDKQIFQQSIHQLFLKK